VTAAHCYKSINNDIMLIQLSDSCQGDSGGP
nr:trypsin-like serine proteinase (EC 3.4.21.-) 1 - nematode (Anisakis simplex) (fragments) [Anisakis simplex]